MPGSTSEAIALLVEAQAALRSRFEDFRGAFERRDEAAHRLALSDFHDRLCRWTQTEERVLLPALSRARISGRDPRRELSLEYVQLRELTRNLRLQIEGHARMADLLGLLENLSRRFDAHEREMLEIYYPAAGPVLTPEERRTLEEAAPDS